MFFFFRQYTDRPTRSSPHRALPKKDILNLIYVTTLCQSDLVYFCEPFKVMSFGTIKGPQRFIFILRTVLSTDAFLLPGSTQLIGTIMATNIHVASLQTRVSVLVGLSKSVSLTSITKKIFDFQISMHQLMPYESSTRRGLATEEQNIVDGQCSLPIPRTYTP